MSIKRLLSIGLLASFGLSVIAQVASAGAGKETGTGDIYVTGFDSRAKVVATYSSLPLTRSATANECGFVKFSTNAMGLSSGTQFSLSGTSVSYGSIPLIALSAAPKCTGGVASQLPSGGVAKFNPNPDSDPTVIWTGKTPFQKYEITLPGVGQERNLVSNACGVVKLSGVGDYANPTGTINVGGQTVTIASLLSFGAGPGCKNNTLLKPVGFP